MKRLTMLVTLSAVLLTGPVWAQETDLVREIDEQYAAQQAAREANQARLNELMGSMAGEMEALRNTQSRKEREAVMVTHRKNMREAMSLMRGMGGTRMREVMGGHLDSGMGHDKAAGKSGHKHKQSMPMRPRGDMSDARRLTDLENRLDMMQVMMESLMNDYAER